MFAADTTADENGSPTFAMHKFPRLFKEGARGWFGGVKGTPNFSAIFIAEALRTEKEGLFLTQILSRR